MTSTVYIDQSTGFSSSHHRVGTQLRQIGRASTGRENCTGWTEDVGQRASCCGDVSNIDKAPMQLQVSVQVQDKNLPTRGNCEERFSFPCWYRISCEDVLFICDECDRADVPDLMRSSGRHTEGHHLIRSQALEEDGDPTGQRLLLEAVTMIRKRS